MAMLVEDLNLLYIMVPGTGCSAVGQKLRHQVDGKFVPQERIYRDGKQVLPRKHNTVDELLEHGQITPEALRELTVFATIRNPFDRFVTYYQRFRSDWAIRHFQRRLDRLEANAADMPSDQYRLKKKAFQKKLKNAQVRQKWVQRVGFNTWLTYTLLRWVAQAKFDPRKLEDFAFPMLTGVDYLIRFENLEESLNQIFRIAGAERRIELPRRNITPGKKHYSAYYNSATRYLVERIFGDALRKYGYRFDGPVDEKDVISVTDLQLA